MKPRLGHDVIGISVVFFCYDSNGRIIFAQRSNNTRDEHGRWDIGAGAVEHGNTIEQQVKKEIKEEYNATALHITFLGYRDVFRTHDGERTHWVGIDCAVLINPSHVHIGEPEKFTALTWATLDTLPAPLHSQLPLFLEKYRTRVKQLLRDAHH